MEPSRISVPGGPAVTLDDAGHLHIGWDEPGLTGPSWLGPGTFSSVDPLASGAVDTTLRAHPVGPVVIVRLETAAGLRHIGPGRFEVPCVGWTFRPQDRVPGDAPADLAGFGYQYTEFALPVRSGTDLSIWTLMPWRPSVVEPLVLVAADGRCLLLGPLDTFHDQIISVPVATELDRGVAWGWHGDLASVPAGFATELAVVGGHGIGDVLARYGELITTGAETVRPDRDSDELGHRLSYWTDNGSAYWYRTEGVRDTPGTIVDTVADLRERSIPVRSVQLDSWFYPHEVLRPFNTDDWVVPPTGLIEWEPRPDVLPDGIETLRTALRGPDGDPPLVAHCRHLSASSPLVDRYPCWVDGDRAHPQDPALYEHWLDRCVDWGVETFEHDWLIECFVGVRGLREAPGRAAAWQTGINTAAVERGITLQWCMASPADMLHAVTLGQVTSVRTSGDHGYLVGPGFLWNWFLITNALARPLGLRPFKDVFWSDQTNPAHHAEVESLLAALSTGPVGLGDRLGGADRAIALRTCRADGVLVRPDVPIAALERSLATDATVAPAALVADAWTDHPSGRWRYVVALNAGEPVERHGPLVDRITVDELGLLDDREPVVAFDWRRGRATVLAAGDGWQVDLGHLDWDLRVLAPIARCGLALIGDPTRYATAGDTLFSAVTDGDDRIAFELLGGEPITVVGWSRTAPAAARERGVDGAWRDLAVDWESDLWRLTVDPAGLPQVEVEVVA